ncbi:MAG: ATP-dependent zinc metalloprotease FtsH [Helicobacteraceae bacterium]|jgi:cell division protease FtsH|nr:ATP-dependent zinc metalloprotease FtsH [Helicobacteraceae bacterium]
MANQNQLPPENNNRRNNNFFNNNPLLIFAIFAVASIALFKYISASSDISMDASTTGAPITQTTSRNLSYSDFKKAVKNGDITQVLIGKNTIQGSGISGTLQTNYYARRVAPDDSLLPLLEENSIPYGGMNEENWLADILFSWVLPILIFFGIWALLTNRMQKSIGGGMLGMGSAKNLISAEKPAIKFDDMAGAEEAKEEVKEIVDFLKNPDRYIRLGAKIPKGILLVGPPGTGKTLLAKAVAGEASVPFFSVSASGFIEMFVGVGAARVRDLFDQAKKQAPAIVFIDELDALGKSRAASGFGGNDEREQTLNQLLAEMDGFASTEPIIILAATNRPEILDPALLRPGRFDRQVLVDKPDFKGRLEILKVHIKSVKLAESVDLETIAKMTAGLAGADLANIVNEATLLAGRKNKEAVDNDDMREAVERSIAGLEKKSRRISPKEKRIVAYHESGHALIAQTTKGAKKVNKVSIIPRGLAALGYTLNTPEENKYLMQRGELIAEIDVLLGGRAAEEIFIGEISTGAANDLERATDIVKAMVTIYGMSDVAGLMVMEKRTGGFLGSPYGYGKSKDYSEKLAEETDFYIKNALTERYEAVKERLSTYGEAIEEIAASLLTEEVIEGAKVREIIDLFETKNGIVREKEEIESVETAQIAQEAQAEQADQTAQEAPNEANGNENA